jgi:uncharacterized membrane protein
LITQVETSTIPVPAARSRLDSIDLLRGVVMVLMALDHTRDFVHTDALRFDPTDLTHTTPLLFMTRWVTHFCAPLFVFLAGVSAYLQLANGATKGTLSRFLFTRGLWLVLLEFTVIRIGMWFNADYSFLGLVQVIWVIGVSMIVLAALVHAPVRLTAAFGLCLIVFHNAFDGVRVAGWQGPGSPVPDPLSKLWILLHQPGEMFPVAGDAGPVVWVMYPLIPWIGVMAAGYAFGRVFTRDAADRRHALRRTGLLLIGMFIALRSFNIYGDPHWWSLQDSAIYSVLSFVNTTKYPPSLLYLLMTIGPALLALSWMDGRRWGRVGGIFVLFGRVPLFFYVLQWPLIHLAAIGLAASAGKEIGYLFRHPPEIFTTAPLDAGFSLPVTYAVWLAVVSVLYVLCRWYAEVKRRSSNPLLRYL